MYSLFGDESSDTKRERVFAVAGLLGTDEQWDALAQKWADCTKREEFHAAKWQTDNRHAEYTELTKALAASGLNGWGVAMSLLDYRTIFDKAADDFLPYYICFIRILQHFGEFTSLLIPRGTLKFTFDQNLDVEYNAAALYNHIAQLPEWEYSRFLENDLSFSSRKNPRIQAADLWTYEVMKHMDNTVVGPVKRPMRRSMEALGKVKRFGFDMLDSGYFEQHKKFALENPRPGDVNYHGWREKLKLSDNTTTRIRYEIYLHHIGRQGNKP